jgi:hypothetical protein
MGTPAISLTIANRITGTRHPGPDGGTSGLTLLP